MSLDERLLAANWRPSGFDYMRLTFALLVVTAHSLAATYGDFDASPYFRALVMDTPIRPIYKSVVPMFFAFSGYLVASSLARSKTLLGFFGLRVIRIYPALVFEILLSALLIGTAVTAFPLASYFQDPLFSGYLLNVIGYTHFFLPGVFENNPYPKVVDVQLWTLPFTLLCYLILPVVAFLGGATHRILLPLSVLGVALIHLVLRLLKYNWHFPIYTAFSGSLLVMCFMTGASFYAYRDKIVWSFRLFCAALVTAIPLLWFVPFGEYPAIPALAYVALYLGHTNVARLPIVKGVDYSYGIYLYHFVIQQLFVQFAAPRSALITALVCVPLSMLAAAFSWRFIEKPAQKLRRPLARAEQRYLAFKARILGRGGRMSLQPSRGEGKTIGQLKPDEFDGFR